MIRGTVKSLEFHEFELSRDDVRDAVIAAVRDYMSDHNLSMSANFTPIIQPDSYGGFKVYVKRASPDDPA